ncbi:MAG: S-layer homology domain-containing protein [Candidatus Gracilibacteria bacterium]
MKKTFTLLLLFVFLGNTSVALNANAFTELQKVRDWNQNFSDIEGHWAEREIKNFYESGIVSGDQGTFSPDRPITRAEFVKLLTLSLRNHINLVPIISEKSVEFFDVLPNAWYEYSLKVLVPRNIIKGYEDGTFRPEAYVNRAEATKALVLAYGISEEQIQADKMLKSGMVLLKDIQTTAWYAKYINTAMKLSLMSGKNDAFFGVSEYLTRAEAVSMLYTATYQTIFFSDDDVKDMSLGYTREPIEPTIVELQDNTSPAGLHVAGNADAPFTMTVFTDFECPGCTYFYFDVTKNLKKEFLDTGILKLVYKDFPLISMHERAFAAANALHCADGQGNASGMYQLLYEKNANWKYNNNMAVALFGFAEQLELDKEVFKKCVLGAEEREAVFANMQDGYALEISGTPTIFLSKTGTGITMEDKVGMQYDAIREKLLNYE